MIAKISARNGAATRPNSTAAAPSFWRMNRRATFGRRKRIARDASIFLVRAVMSLHPKAAIHIAPQGQIISKEALLNY